jgi:hypothetical protein
VPARLCILPGIRASKITGAVHTVAVVSRPAQSDASGTRPLLEACVAICKSCGDECGRHAAMHEHCRVCEQACRRCEQACRELLDIMK